MNEFRQNGGNESYIMQISRYLLLAFIFHLVSGCSAPKWYFGVGGKYNEAMIELGRGRGGNIDKAILNLEGVARQDPTYRETLTQLGRAYYRKGRYQDAYMILQRALALNREDEIGWLVMGITQLQLGDDEKGLESLKGGLTLLNRVNGYGYRGYERWDQAGRVKVAIRNAVFVALKGLEEKEKLIRSVERVLAQIDNEEFARRTGFVREFEEEYN